MSSSLPGGEAAIAVVGARVVGVATAYALARRGARVVLLDRADGPARGASFANAAPLSYAFTGAMAGPALGKQRPDILGGRDAAVRTRLAADRDSLRWGLAFPPKATQGR